MSWFRSKVSKPADPYFRGLRIPWRFPYLESPKFPGPEGVGRWHGCLPSLETLHTLTDRLWRPCLQMTGIVDFVGSVWPLSWRRRHREGVPSAGRVDGRPVLYSIPAERTPLYLSFCSAPARR